MKCVKKKLEGQTPDNFCTSPDHVTLRPFAEALLSFGLRCSASGYFEYSAPLIPIRLLGLLF